VQHGISVIVPTIGRIESLSALLESLAAQSLQPDEVVVVGGGNHQAVAELVGDERWMNRGLAVRFRSSTPANAVSKRLAGIAEATGDRLLFLDDDVVLDRDCLRRLNDLLCSDSAIAAVSADTSNQDWPGATTAWRWYLRSWLGLRDGEWHGRVVGPLLRFGYPPHPQAPVRMEWFGTANTLVRRAAYDAAGGFSTFFLHRSTMNEDVDLSLKIARHGRILLTPEARLEHFHHPSGRVSVFEAAEDDLYNRYLILTRTLGRSTPGALAQIATFFVIETTSNIIGAVRRRQIAGLGGRLGGRSRALLRIGVHIVTAQ
jgi:GT2 family glycosyltransferase